MVEDLNTEPYLIDTLLNHLIRAGKLDGVGRLRRSAPTSTSATRRCPRAPESTLSIEEMLDELIAPARHPRDRQRPVRARQAHGDASRSACGPASTADAKTLDILEAGGGMRRLLLTPCSRCCVLRRRPRTAQRRQGAAHRLGAGPGDAEPVRRPRRGGLLRSGRSTGTCWSTSTRRRSSPRPASRKTLEGRRGRQDRHLQARPRRQVVRRQAGHLRRRQVVAGRARRRRRAVHRLHDQRQVDRDAGRRDRRPARQEARTRASSAACSSTSCPSTSGARCRSRS